MKKLILFLFLCIFLLPGYSQSLELYYEEELLENEESLTMIAHADSGTMTFEGLTVLNKGDNPLNIKCTREVISEVLNSKNSFCWGICYSTTTDTSTVTIKINSGEVSNEFVGDYFPMGNPGITTVKYIFYDVANPDDRIAFIINYKAITESATPEDISYGLLSAAYPNPANKEVSVDYDLIPGKEDIKFVIYNLLGTIVKESRISEYSGSLKLNTSDLVDGIYFYSLLINNEPFHTHKLIIKH